VLKLPLGSAHTHRRRVGCHALKGKTPAHIKQTTDYSPDSFSRGRKIIICSAHSLLSFSVWIFSVPLFLCAGHIFICMLQVGIPFFNSRTDAATDDGIPGILVLKLVLKLMLRSSGAAVFMLFGAIINKVHECNEHRARYE